LSSFANRTNSYGGRQVRVENYDDSEDEEPGIPLTLFYPILESL